MLTAAPASVLVVIQTIFKSTMPRAGHPGGAPTLIRIDHRCGNGMAKLTKHQQKFWNVLKHPYKKGCFNCYYSNENHNSNRSNSDKLLRRCYKHAGLKCIYGWPAFEFEDGHPQFEEGPVRSYWRWDGKTN